MPQLIPFGDRILVKRRCRGEKIGTAGLIIATDTAKDQPTELADIVYLPELSFADKELIENSETIIKSLIKRAREGSSEALNALIEFNKFLTIKSLKVSDTILLSKYVGTDLYDSSGREMTIVNGDDVRGVVNP